jgi:hypothetical protein
MRVLFIFVFAALGGVIAFAQFGTTQKNLPAGALERPIYAQEGQPLNTPAAFRISILRARLPGGAAAVVGCQDDLKRHWNPQGESLAQVLNEMTAVDKSYRWEVQDGAINLLPTTGEPSLLKTQVGEFNIETTSSLKALTPLQVRPEVAKAMQDIGLQHGIVIISYSPRLTPFSVRFKGGTLRQALNAIAVAHGTDVWDYQEIRCGERKEVIIRF